GLSRCIAPPREGTGVLVRKRRRLKIKVPSEKGRPALGNITDDITGDALSPDLVIQRRAIRGVREDCFPVGGPGDETPLVGRELFRRVFVAVANEFVRAHRPSRVDRWLTEVSPTNSGPATTARPATCSIRGGRQWHPPVNDAISSRSTTTSWPTT